MNLLYLASYLYALIWCPLIKQDAVEWLLFIVYVDDMNFILLMLD